MSLIQNFPDQLLDMHHHWHSPSSHAGAGPGRVHPAGSPGGGLEFLTFHRDFVAAFHQWYDVQPFADQAAVSPWHEVPAALKVSGAGWTQGWANDETRLKTNNPAFNSADELGTFIENGIHNNFLHGAASIVFNEPVVATFHSPLSTYFYQIHGLVQWWWDGWETGHVPDVAHGILKVLVQQILGGVAVDGGGFAIGAGGRPKKINPWGPVMENPSHIQVAKIHEDLQRISQH